MTWIGRDCDDSVVGTCGFNRVNIRIYDLNWKGLWHLVSPFLKMGTAIQSEFMTWIGRHCDIIPESDSHSLVSYQNLWPELEGIVTWRRFFDALSPPHQSEFMTWIGRDCDILSFAFSNSSISASEFMTWIGRDCDHIVGPSQAQRHRIRIYDLNWKGLWPCGGFVFLEHYAEHQNLWPELEGIVTFLERLQLFYLPLIRIYDLNWKGLWRRDSLFCRLIKRLDQNLWPELEGIVTFLGKPGVSLRWRISEFMTWIGRDCDYSWTRKPPFFLIWDQNLWPELEGIVTVREPFNRYIFVRESEFMTWIGRDCDPSSSGKPASSAFASEFMTWIGRDCDRGAAVGKGLEVDDQNLWPELEGIVT